MKYMIASDIHGSACYCRDMLAAFDREGADRLLLLGDLLYHGPRNDLPAEYAPKEVLALLNAHKRQIFCVRGNCDTEVDQMVLDFPILADYCLLTAGSRLIFATHGHHYNTSKLPSLQPGDILLHGHTHIPAWESFGAGCLYLNPGSVSIPKEGSEHSYMTLDSAQGKTEFLWKTLNGSVFHSLVL
ncbi:MAG: phosphodiesterase [Lachnospiraceae bacterium]|nr:phosphodiesterase [Lachnospiraceae bacterium]